MRLAASLTCISVFFSVVQGHGALVNVAGANGVNGAGFGIDASTPRDGTRARPFQQDTSIIRDREIASGKASACGRTRLNGVNDIASNLQAAAAAGLPSAGANGEIAMTLHQVNGDGAGPYSCDVNADGTGQTFQPMVVTTNVPGTNSRSRAKATDFPLVATMPAGTNCTGGPDGNACIVRCRNTARAGPFGGCVAVTNGNGGAAAGGNAAGGNAAAGAAAEGTAAEGTAAAGTAAEGTGAAGTAAEGAAAEGTAAGTAVGGNAAGGNSTEAAGGTADDAAVQEAEAAEAAADDADTNAGSGSNAGTSTGSSKSAKGGAGGVGGILDAVGGAGAGAGAGGNGGAGGLSGIFGGAGGLGGLLGGGNGGGGLGGLFGGGRGGDKRKRLLRSRIVSRELAGRWI